jgi:tRNA(Ile)-lysidine synthase
MRGTGIKGITGIKPKMNLIVRPLLFAERKDIVQYVTEAGIDYREDSSNQSLKYSRNKIRHQIIPEFQKLNPAFLETTRENMERFQDAYAIYMNAIERIKAELTFQKDSDLYIDIHKLGDHDEKRTLLFEILKEYGFSKETVREILNRPENEPGKEYLSLSHKLISDRAHYIVTSKGEEKTFRYYIDENTSNVEYPVHLNFNVIEDIDDYDIPEDAHVASLDYDKLTFPLILRNWLKGDYFKPFGFDHHKKLSDFFVDRKYSILDKERVWILASGEMIVWIVGDRIDDRFKVDTNTKRVLQIIYQKETSA